LGALHWFGRDNDFADLKVCSYVWIYAQNTARLHGRAVLRTVNRELFPAEPEEVRFDTIEDVTDNDLIFEAVVGRRVLVDVVGFLLRVGFLLQVREQVAKHSTEDYGLAGIDLELHLRPRFLSH